MNGLEFYMGWHSSQYILAQKKLLNRMALCPIRRVVETLKMILLVVVSLAQGINMYHSQCIQMASTKHRCSAGQWEQFYFLMHSNAPEWKIRAIQFFSNGYWRNLCTNLLQQQRFHVFWQNKMQAVAFTSIWIIHSQ